MKEKVKNRLYGYTGNLIKADLTSGKIKVESVGSEILKEFLGGVGFGVKFLYDELPKDVDPFSPDNKLIFTTGPLTGTKAPGSGFAEVCFKSPLTGIWGESKCGGEWGGALKKAGYDFLVIEGKVNEPKYIVINDDRIEIIKADKLRGKTTSQKDKHIKEELRDELFEIAVIGPAGENLVRFANVMVEGRAFGRCGAGAVMGSKNLLAIAVKGSKEIPIARPDEFSSLSKELKKKVLEVTGKEGWSEGGTTGFILDCDEEGDIPTKNWRSNSWGKGEQLYGHFKSKNLLKAYPCYKGCILRCGRITEVKSGKWKTPKHGGAEYESICAFTYFILNEDMDAAVHATYLCNEYGMDTISTGAVIAFAMECYEKNLISKKDKEKIDLSWGNAHAVIKLTEKIANREGIGWILGEGTRIASQKIGKGSEEFAIQVKGLEGPAHDPRSGKALALIYGLSNRGMCHIHPIEGQAYDAFKSDFGLISYGLTDPKNIDRYTEKGKGKETKKLQDWGIIPDIVGICKFYIYCGLDPGDIAKLISSLTGWDMNAEKLLAIGESVYDLQRKFNIREGIQKSDDRLSKRVTKLPEFGKYSKVKECEIKDFDKMLEECYQARGW